MAHDVSTRLLALVAARCTRLGFTTRTFRHWLSVSRRHPLSNRVSGPTCFLADQAISLSCPSSGIGSTDHVAELPAGYEHAIRDRHGLRKGKARCGLLSIGDVASSRLDAHLAVAELDMPVQHVRKADVWNMFSFPWIAGLEFRIPKPEAWHQARDWLRSPSAGVQSARFGAAPPEVLVGGWVGMRGHHRAVGAGALHWHVVAGPGGHGRAVLRATGRDLSLSLSLSLDAETLQLQQMMMTMNLIVIMLSSYMYSILLCGQGPFSQG